MKTLKQKYIEAENERATLQPAETFVLMRKVYNAVSESHESLEHDDMLGPDLAYLMGAMLNDTFIELPPDRQLVITLHNLFDVNHQVWNYVQEEVIL